MSVSALLSYCATAGNAGLLPFGKGVKLWSLPDRRAAAARSTPALSRLPTRVSRLNVSHISVRRGGNTVLDDLSFSLPSGSITVIVGPSGAGKSTLISTLNGLIAPVSGEIALSPAGTASRHKPRTSTIFQEHALIDRLTALENVLLGLAEHRHPFSVLPWSLDAERKAATALQNAGLLHLAHARAGALSGGERQRVGIARALVRAPDLLLGDEPFSSIDPALVHKISEEFRTLVKSSGITVVLVLHQVELARLLADRIIGLAGGRISFNGAADDFDDDACHKLFHPTP